MKVENWIERCEDGHDRHRSEDMIDTIAIHRIGYECGRDAAEIKGFFDTLGEFPGMPYTFVIDAVGRAMQAQPVSDITPHARRWNTRAIGIACIGDFRERPATRAQWVAAVELCAVLCPCFNIDPRTAVCGHMELPHSSSDPTKECPGKFWVMDQFRAEVHEMGLRASRLFLEGAGIVV